MEESRTHPLPSYTRWLTAHAREAWAPQGLAPRVPIIACNIAAVIRVLDPAGTTKPFPTQKSELRFRPELASLNATNVASDTKMTAEQGSPHLTPISRS